jgi:Na+/H+ antiporter
VKVQPHNGDNREVPNEHGIQGLEIVLPLMLLFVAVFAALARRLSTPYPIVMVIGGLLLSFVPGIPGVALDPDIVFFLILPPLLYGAAWATSWREFFYNLTSILLLAIGLVTFTVISVAACAQWMLPGLDWRTGFVLGSVVAPTDAIAATTIARRLGLNRRIVDILEGESLVNDATALVALSFGVALVVHGITPTFSEGFLRLGYLAAIGIAVGLGIGFLVDALERRIEDAPIEITISILVPYAAYLGAEELHGSGVLAVVAAGLFLSRRSVGFFSPAVRMQATAVWDSLIFILNGLVFVIIGLQLPYVFAQIQQYSMGDLFLYGASFSALIVVLRLIWVYPGAWVSYYIRTRFLKQDETPPSPRAIFIIGWTGMRGVIALAAALSLPVTIAEGRPFPHRDLIVFLTFCVILVTLVVQGLSLPPIIRLLRLSGGAARDDEEHEARRKMVESALEFLERAGGKDRLEFADVYEDLTQHHRTRLATLLGEGNDEHGTAAEHEERYRELTRELLGIERQTAIRLRDENKISDDVLRKLLHELDLAESRLLIA